MENQPIEQTTEQSMEQTSGQTVEPGSSASIWYIAVAAVLVVLAVAYFIMKSPVPSEVMTDSQALTEQTSPALTEGNTTADISADLDLIADPSAELDADSATVSGDLQSL